MPVFSVRQGRLINRGFRLTVRPSVPVMVGRLVGRRVWDWRREAGVVVGALVAVGWLAGAVGAGRARLLVLVGVGVVVGVPRWRHAGADWWAGGRWRRRWAAACRACGLVASWERTPRIRAVRPTPAGIELAIQVRAGQSLLDVDRAGPALAAALGVRSLSLAGDPLHAGRATVLLRMRDPLARTVDPEPLPPGDEDRSASGGRLELWFPPAAPAVPVPAAAPAGGAGVAVPAGRRSGRSGVGPVVVGRREDGRAWLLPIAGSHVLVAGATGAGKGSVLWGVVRGLAPAIRAGLVEVWACDPKGGMELAAGERLFAGFAYDLDLIADMLEDLAGAMTARAGRMRGRSRLHVPRRGDPLVVILIDEIGHVVSYAPKEIRDRVSTALRLLLSQGRAVGYSVVAAVQDPRKETVPFRDLFPVRVALRMAEAAQVDLVLGRGAWDAGAHCEQIPLDQQGAGYVRSDDAPVPVAVRAAWQDDDTIRDLAARYGQPGSDADGSGFSAGGRPRPTGPSGPSGPAGPVGGAVGWVPQVEPAGRSLHDWRTDTAAVLGADGGPPTVPLRGWRLPPPPALPAGSSDGGRSDEALRVRPSGRISETDVDAWERWAAGWRRAKGLDTDGRPRKGRR